MNPPQDLCNRVKRSYKVYTVYKVYNVYKVNIVYIESNTGNVNDVYDVNKVYTVYTVNKVYDVYSISTVYTVYFVYSVYIAYIVYVVYRVYVVYTPHIMIAHRRARYSGNRQHIGQKAILDLLLTADNHQPDSSRQDERQDAPAPKRAQKALRSRPSPFSYPDTKKP